MVLLTRTLPSFDLWPFAVSVQLTTPCRKLHIESTKSQPSPKLDHYSTKIPSLKKVTSHPIIAVSMERLFQLLSAPGCRSAVECAAPTQIIPGTPEEENKNELSIPENSNSMVAYNIKPKDGRLDRGLDRVVDWSGSQTVFFFILIALLTWALMGIRFGTNTKWQVFISDAQAIINMIFDAFLMRQQLNSYDELMFVTACLRSRTSSNKRMLRKLMASGEYENPQPAQFHELQQTEFLSDLPRENLLGRVSTGVSIFMGHIGTVGLYWVCIFIWIGFGRYCSWSNTWQLYINSATSALMVFILAFLANIRARHSKYSAKCLEHIHKVDTALETRLRTVTSDTIPNTSVLIPVPKRGRLQRAIDYYADLVGTLLGIAILAFVMVLWVALGPVLHFDSNWWLLIGTYAGLVGLNDGFVLCNIQSILGRHLSTEFTHLIHSDHDMLSEIRISSQSEEYVVKPSLTSRISIAVGKFCSHELTVVGGVVMILALVIGASVMRWSVTGQLLCNVPPSIIESFFMMILITGHDIADAKMRVDLHNVYLRRLKLVSWVDSLGDEKKEGEMDMQVVEVNEEMIAAVPHAFVVEARL